MITFKAIVIPGNRLKDGTYPVKVRVTFKGVSRRLPTTLYATSNDLTRSLKIKSADILNRTDGLIADMRDAVKDVSPFDLDNWDVDKVVAHIRKKLTADTFRLDFFEWSERYLVCKTPVTRRAYDNALNTFERFLGERKIDVNDITRSMLLDFVDFVDSQPKIYYDHKTGERKPCKVEKIARASSSRHLMKLQHLYNASKDRYNDEDSGRIVIPRSPFNTITKVFPASQGQKNLGAELMQRIINAQTADPMERIALDAFVLSFGLMGANMADLYNAVPFTGQWVYNRQKVATRRADKAEMRVDIPEVLAPYIERLQGSGRGWWLPALHRVGKDKDICTAKVNRALKRWCEKNEIQPFTFYSARHTWGSLARNSARIEKALVDECLCHKGDFALADIYIERDYALINEANRKVLDLFQW